MGDSVQKT